VPADLVPDSKTGYESKNVKANKKEEEKILFLGPKCSFWMPFWGPMKN
jgi:hypothetical protein